MPHTTAQMVSDSRPLQPQTFLGEAQKHVSNLGNALDLGPMAKKALREAVDLSMASWGRVAIPSQPNGWLCEVSHDHSPVEYSVAIEQRTGAAQLRFLTESQHEHSSIEAYQQSALKLTSLIGTKFPDVSLERLARIAHLFFPMRPEGNFAAWHSYAVNPDAKSEWKIYLNPCAQGDLYASDTIHDALFSLGMSSAYVKLQAVMTPGSDKFIYFALDLKSSSQARVKVYIQHCNASAESVALKMDAVAPGTTSVDEIRRFCTTLSGFDGPYTGKALQTCFGFTRDATTSELKTEATLYFPVSHYASDDAEICQRVEEYLVGCPREEDGACAPVSPLAKYRKCVDAVAKRNLEQGRGIHSYVGLKETKDRGSVVNFYLSAEMFGTLPEN